MARSIGSVGPSLGKYTFNRDGSRIQITGLFRATRVGARREAPANGYLNARADLKQIIDHCSAPLSGILLNSEIIPQRLDDGFSAASEKFPPCFYGNVRWLLCLPRIEENVQPADGFELSMADTAAGETETFVSGLDRTIAPRLLPDIRRTLFVNPTFIDSFAEADLHWVATIVRLTGKVILSHWR